MEVNVSVIVSISDLDAEEGTDTGTRIVWDDPGENTGVEPPFCPRSAQPIVLEIPIWKESDCAPKLVTMKVRVVVNPGSVVRSAGVDNVAIKSENFMFEVLIKSVSLQPPVPLKITEAVNSQTPVIRPEL